MTGPQWFIAAAIALHTVGLVALPARIGKPREPITTRDATCAVVSYLLVLAGYAWVWVSL